MSRTQEYDGPGVYEVTVAFSGSTTLEVEANSIKEAQRKAMEKAYDVPVDCDPSEITDIECVARMGTIGEDVQVGELTGLEEACWMITGKIPDEAVARVALERAQAEAVA